MAAEPSKSWPGALPTLGLLLAIVVGAIVIAAAFDDARSVASLEAGDCLRAPEDDQVTQVDPVGCDEPHELEVVGSVALDGEAYPGDSQVFADGLEACRGVFEDYVGEPYDTSRWFLNAFTPSEEGWNAGDRSATCLVFQFDDNLEYVVLTESVRNAAG